MFRTPESVFQSGKNPQNHCYCSPNLPKSPIDWCKEIDGFSMIDQARLSVNFFFSRFSADNLKKCQFGAPAIASAPHFLSGSDFFFEVLDGLEPNDVEHVSYVVYEPTSGSIIHNAKRLQALGFSIDTLFRQNCQKLQCKNRSLQIKCTKLADQEHARYIILATSSHF